MLGLLPNKESEKDTEKYLIRKVKALGGKSYKWSSPMCKGIPDRICILPGNKVFFVEIKSEGKEPTPLQYHVLFELSELGCYATWADTKARVDEILKEVQK